MKDVGGAGVASFGVRVAAEPEKKQDHFRSARVVRIDFGNGSHLSLRSFSMSKGKSTRYGPTLFKFLGQDNS